MRLKKISKHSKNVDMRNREHSTIESSLMKKKNIFSLYKSIGKVHENMNRIFFFWERTFSPYDNLCFYFLENNFHKPIDTILNHFMVTS